MCVVSMVGDHYTEKWKHRWPTSIPYPDSGTYVWPLQPTPKYEPISEISRQEFDDLKKEVAEMVALLKRAKKYDEDNNEPSCETEEKIALLRRIAEVVGVDLDKAVAL